MPSRPASASSPVQSVLAALDRAREAAYARRDPSLLAQVYSSPVLLARDRERMLALVPRGCVLTGLRSTFAGVRTVRAGRRMRVHARVRVRADALVCRGATREHTAAARPAAMTIELRRTPAGYRITAERRE